MSQILRIYNIYENILTIDGLSFSCNAFCDRFVNPAGCNFICIKTSAVFAEVFLIGYIAIWVDISFCM